MLNKSPADSADIFFANISAICGKL